MGKRIGNQDFRTASHAIYRLTYHVIWCIKFRRHILSAERRDFLIGKLREEAVAVNCEIVEANGEADHFHFIVDTPPTVCVSELVGRLKSKTASALLDEYGSFFYGKHLRSVWSSGFFVATTGGVTLETLRKYVENQGPTNKS
jgi:putative transposase